MIGMLVAGDPCHKAINLGRIYAHWQSVERGEEAQPVGGIDLKDGRRCLGIIKRPNRNLQIPAPIIAERRAALAAKPARHLVRTGPGCGTAACPFDTLRRHKWPEKPAKRLLAHTAMTNRRPAQRGNPVPHRATLASTFMEHGRGPIQIAILKTIPSGR